MRKSGRNKVRAKIASTTRRGRKEAKKEECECVREKRLYLFSKVFIHTYT